MNFKKWRDGTHTTAIKVQFAVDAEDIARILLLEFSNHKLTTETLTKELKEFSSAKSIERKVRQWILENGPSWKSGYSLEDLIFSEEEGDVLSKHEAVELIYAHVKKVLKLT